jgi:hypothetical protein
MKTIQRVKWSKQTIHSAKHKTIRFNWGARNWGDQGRAVRDRTVMTMRSGGLFGEPVRHFGSAIYVIDDLRTDQLGTADWESRMRLHASETEAEFKELQHQINEVQAAYALLKRFQAEQESPHSRLMKVLRLPQAKNILQKLLTTTTVPLGIGILVQGEQELKIVSEFVELGYLTMSEGAVQLSPKGKELLSKLDHQKNAS